MTVLFDKAKDDRFNPEAVLLLLEPSFRRAFLELLLRLRTHYTEKEVIDLLRSGNLEGLEKIIDDYAQGFASSINSGFIVSGQKASELLREKLGIVVTFDQVNERAVESMRNNQLRLIRQFTEEQRRIVRLSMTEGIQQGLNPKTQAKAFVDNIGLTEKQLSAINTYRRLLTEGSAQALERALRDKRYDSTVLRAASGEFELSKDQIDTMVRRYRERMFKYRSQVIARTEALRAAHEGSYELFLQAVEKGELSPYELQREWLTARDERVRGSHRTMHRQKRGFNEPFISGAGNFLRYPGDSSAPAKEVIQCRCVVTTRISRST